MGWHGIACMKWNDMKMTMIITWNWNSMTCNEINLNECMTEWMNQLMREWINALTNEIHEMSGMHWSKLNERDGVHD